MRFMMEFLRDIYTTVADGGGGGRFPGWASISKEDDIGRSWRDDQMFGGVNLSWHVSVHYINCVVAVEGAGLVNGWVTGGRPGPAGRGGC